MAEKYISESRKYVTVLHDNGEEDHFTIEEFEETYGYDPLEEDLVDEEHFYDVEHDFDDYLDSIVDTSPEEVYWEKFIELCDVSGRIQALRAIIRNAEDGVYPVQEVVHEYFNHDLSNVDRSLELGITYREKTMTDLDQIGQNLGFKPFSNQDKKRFYQFLAVEPRRRYVHRWAYEYQKRGMVVSARDMVIQSYRKQKSLWPEKWKREGCPY